MLEFSPFNTRNTRCQAGRGFEQLGLVEGVPAHGGGWNEMSFKAPPNPNRSVICVGTQRHKGFGFMTDFSILFLLDQYQGQR